MSISGWQLPTYNGTKSYQNLLVEVYEMVEYGYFGYIANADVAIQFEPTNFIRGGFYKYSYGDNSLRRETGAYWRNNASSAVYGGYLYFAYDFITTHNQNPKGDGYLVRCFGR